MQRIYSEARKNSGIISTWKTIKIEGGDYKLCNGFEKSCGGIHCLRNRVGRGGF